MVTLSQSARGQQVYTWTTRQSRLSDLGLSWFLVSVWVFSKIFLSSSRHGLGEERDLYRLKDNKGGPVICFRCGKSALPDDTTSASASRRIRRSSHASSLASSHSDSWKGIISCDFCNLHWHVDCLDPPLTSIPPLNRKWKCPNHANNSAVCSSAIL